jgi:hypothetical protein
MGTASGQGSFTCLSGSCSNGNGMFSGTVQANGDFTGTTHVTEVDAYPVTGTFSTSGTFRLQAGGGGSVSQTLDCRKS